MCLKDYDKLQYDPFVFFLGGTITVAYKRSLFVIYLICKIPSCIDRRRRDQYSEAS